MLPVFKGLFAIRNIGCIVILSCLTTFSSQELIDIVYLWVDGSDPVWLSIKNEHLLGLNNSQSRYLPDGVKPFLLLGIAQKHASDATSHNRFNDNEELKYSLRSVYTYAPFYHHIYLVTMNQRPSWLIDHPDITVVDHQDIFKNLEHLPTFNSHAIESNIHRIPGLSENFIYFNDDVFLGQMLKPEDFFIDGKLNVQLEKGLSPDGPPEKKDSAYRRAWRNTNAFLNALFGREPRQRLCHAPFALKKSLMHEFDEKYPAIFYNNSTHKFRSDDDFNVTNGLLQFYWKYHDLVVHNPLTNLMISLSDDKHLIKNLNLLELLETLRPATFCIQDVSTNHFDKTREALKRFLEAYYPYPAPWEKISN